MKKIKTLLAVVLLIFFCLISVDSFAGKRYADFVNDFKVCLHKDFNARQLSYMFRVYSPLLSPHSDVSTFFNRLKGEMVLPYPLADFKKESVYRRNIRKLVNSSNDNHRILSYLVIASSNDRSFVPTLLKRIKEEKNRGGRIWAGMALLHMKTGHTDELFDFLVANENFGDAHMVPLYMKHDRRLLQNTAWKKLESDNLRAKILASAILGATGKNKKSVALLKKAVKEWPLNIKGYAVHALRSISAGNLLGVLEPFLKEKTIRRVCLQALASSPTEEDRNYILSLIPKKGEVSEEVLDLLLESSRLTHIKKWLSLVQTDRIPKKYAPSIDSDNRLFSREMRKALLAAVPDIKNYEVLSDIAKTMGDNTYYNTVDVLISLLTHKDDTVRYWSGFSLKDTRSDKLKKIIPSIIKNPAYRTVALTRLAFNHNLSDLHIVYEDILEKNGGNLDWRRSCIEYLSQYPLQRHRELFLKHLLEPKEDWSIRRDAALGLGRLKDSTAAESIINIMEDENVTHNNDYNKLVYLQALSMIKGEKAKKAIAKYKNSNERKVRMFVQKTLKTWNK